ncbi:MAG TPA: protein translocase subunit SecD [Acidimicrobiales bacterium]|nr:protein translocase subunit SecD [Acidimicrobiales bacterium]
MKKYALGSLAIWMVVLIVGLGATFVFDWRPVLGLDLQGGLSTTLVPKEGTHPPEESVSEAAKIIRQRVDGLGIAEPDVVRSGKTVVVQLPGLKSRADQERAKGIIGTTAKLQYHQVLADLGPATPMPTQGSSPPATATPSASSAPSATSAPATSGPATSAPSDTNENSMGIAPERALGVDPIAYRAPPPTTTPPTTAPATTAPPTTAGVPTTTLSIEDQLKAFMAQHPGSKIYTGEGNRYVLGPVLFDGTVLSSADAQLNSQNSQWEVNVKVKNSRKGEVNKVFNECFSGKDVCPPIRQGDAGSQHGAVAMVLDGAVISAPTVNAVDLPKNPNGFVITGNFTQKSAESLALQLRYGALPVEFQPATMETVSATLGSNSLNAALVAGLIGLILVAIYMLAFYKLLGFVAILSLASSTAMVWIVICYMGANNGLALTLAGITGIIVSIGIAVDSNVVFYEHLREDMSKGRSLQETVRPSFKTAWGTIVSADFVSIMGAVILYILTVGSVRGFAFYLGLSTFVDLLASWFFMRPLTFWLASRKVFNRRPGLLGVKPFDVDPDAIVAGKSPNKPKEAMA